MLETVMVNPKIAEQDILCYKVISKPFKVNGDEMSVHVKSNVIGYDYTVGQLNVQIDVHVDKQVYTDVDGSRFLIVKEGYHSYVKPSDIMAVSSEQDIRECVIPKGERYFADAFGKQLVSSNIIITEKTVEQK